MKHIIALLLENEPGALSRVVALFSARGYNIESLTVAPTEDASLSRMTMAQKESPSSGNLGVSSTTSQPSSSAKTLAALAVSSLTSLSTAS